MGSITRYVIASSDQVASIKNKGIIHLIDDEKDVVNVVSSALQRNGYVVHAFSRSSEALEDMEKCKEKVSMVITDIRMPEYSGFDIARRARAIVPSVPIVFMTAFEINDSEFKKVFPSLGGDVQFLEKPFHIEKLLSVVQKQSISPSK